MQQNIDKNRQVNEEDKPGIHLYFRPVYSKEFKSVWAMESYMELIDEKIGILPPERYVEIAEQSGKMEQLIEYEVEAICRLLNGFEEKNMYIDFVTVYLPVGVLNKDGFAGKIFEIIESYKVRKEMIAFEIPCSILGGMTENCKININAFKEAEMNIVLREFAGKDCNIMDLHKIDADYCVVDASLAKYMSGSSNEKKMYANLLRLINDLGIKAISDGIDEKKTYDEWEQNFNSVAAIGKKVGMWFEEEKLCKDRRAVRYEK